MPPVPTRAIRRRGAGLLSRRLLILSLVLFFAAALTGSATVISAAKRPSHVAPVSAQGPCGPATALHTDVGIVCVHGDDEAFAADRQSARQSGQQMGIPCQGNGRSGNRIAFYYAYIKGHPNRLWKVRSRLRAAIRQANYAVYKSARQTRGNRWLRVLTDNKCRPIIRSIRLPHSAASSFGNTINAASAAGLHATNRKYVLFVDSTALCGVATLAYDDRPGPDNVNNGGPSWARVDRGCWSGYPTAHEIFHMLGAVQETAPHFDNTGHCTDDRDIMCYQNAGGKHVSIRCRPSVDDDRLDCGKDDYFNTRPRAGSYLARHWNTASSSFLYGGGPAQPVAPRSVRRPSAAMLSLGHARLRWSAPYGSTVTGYDVMKNGSVVWHGRAQQWDDTSAAGGNDSYQVRAVNTAGPGPWSSVLTAKLPMPAAPQHVVATSDTSVSWTADSAFVQYYFFYGVNDDGSTHFIGVLSADQRSATDATWSYWRTWHSYRVCAYNSVGTACTDEAAG